VEQSQISSMTSSKRPDLVTRVKVRRRWHRNALQSTSNREVSIGDTTTFVGSTEMPPFTVRAFTDAEETCCVGNYVARRWEEARVIAQAFIDHAGWVFVQDSKGERIEHEKWI